MDLVLNLTNRTREAAPKDVRPAIDKAWADREREALTRIAEGSGN